MLMLMLTSVLLLQGRTMTPVAGARGSDPNVFTVAEFLTERETAHLISICGGSTGQEFKQSFTDSEEGAEETSTERTSTSMHLKKCQDATVRKII